MTSLYIYEMSSSEVVTRSFLAGDDYIIRTSPVFPGDFIESTSMYDANATTETASTQTDETDATTVTPMLLELAKDKSAQDEDSSTTTTEAGETSSTVMTTTTEVEEGETMTPLDRFVSTTGKPVEATLESEAETETTKAVKTADSFFCSTGLPLARTRRVRSTFSSQCPLSSNLCR